MTDPREQAALRDQCTVFLTGHGPVRAADLLASIPADTVPDRYGDGGVVAELEAEVAGLLGKPAAVYLPSGTMAQQSVLRVHADRRQRRTVVYHPLCHLDRHEDRAFQRLHGLTGRPAGDPVRLMTADDLTAIAEPPGALLIELPQRDLGGPSGLRPQVVPVGLLPAQVALRQLDQQRRGRSGDRGQVAGAHHPGRVAGRAPG